jgi:hypothetical protein
MSRVWLILDGRAWDDPDDAAVYEAFSEEDGDTVESVTKTRDEDWEDGVIFEYDVEACPDAERNLLVNQRLVG